MTKYILALDQGTTSSRAILLDKKGEIIDIAQKEIKQYYPKPGWVEQNPDEIWESQYAVILALLKKTNTTPEKINAIGITNQRETTVIWNKHTGRPIYNAIVWQDKRTANICKKITDAGLENYIRKNTGLVIDSYFSGTKIKWLLENVPNAKEDIENDNLLFGTIDTWLIWKLTQGELHITDYTNASRTLLFNIKSLSWDSYLLAQLNIPVSILPKVVPSSFQIGFTHSALFSGIKIPIAGIAGDQQAALFGQAAFEPGMAKNTYGTGCFILQNTGNKQVNSTQGLITTLTCQTQANKPGYALEGSVFIAGAAIKWLRDALHMIENAMETHAIAEEISDNDGVYVVPAFVGLGAPYWDMYAKGAIFGLSLGSTDKHIVKATLESLAYQSKDVLDAMKKDSGVQIKTLHVDGGAAENNYLMQFQADILNTPVHRPKNIETTAMGAAFLAGLATGFWKNKEEIIALTQIDRVFNPKMEADKARTLYNGWQKAIERTLGWENEC